MIVATAGHVDHGKTSLVKQLTGVDTDRLEEEKRRGLSINLGFAYRQLNAGNTLGFIDVPGHRRFINTMIAGISGIDLGMLVVAADDGLMPQTHEHLDVLRLLGVTSFLLVLSKIDRVDETRQAEVRAQASALLPAGTEVFPISNISGEGISTLQARLDELAELRSQRAGAGHFRLPIDRAFHLKGAGIVVTGTVSSGTVHVGDQLLLRPQEKMLRVRTIHAQDREASEGQTGQRCALNVVGDVDKEDLRRGDWLVSPDSGPGTGRFDARLSLLGSAPFPVKHMSPVKIHLGARRVAGRLFLLEQNDTGSRLRPGESALVQLMIDESVMCSRGDRFLIRDDSESYTLGGGVVLDPYAPRSGKAQISRLNYLYAMEPGDSVAALAKLVLEDNSVLNVKTLRDSWNATEDEMGLLLATERLRKIQRVQTESGELLLSPYRWQEVCGQVTAGLLDWHDEFPAEAAIKPAQLKARLPGIDDLFLPVISALVKARKVILREGQLQFAGRTAQLPAAEQLAWQKVQKLMHSRGSHIPLVSEIVTETGLPAKVVQQVLRRAGKDKVAHKLNDNRYGLPETLRQLARLASELAQADGAFTVIQFRDGAGVGRKLAIEVLEYFDDVRYTQRREQLRTILDEGLPEQLYSD